MLNKKVTTKDIEFELKSNFEKGKALIAKLERSGDLPKPQQPTFLKSLFTQRKSPKAKKRKRATENGPIDAARQRFLPACPNRNAGAYSNPS
ncbi:MAG: hypothetical protein IT331_08155 [Anaerolineae bacterium]|nr:hypothetical protein [Anaerolineae bacterium]